MDEPSSVPVPERPPAIDGARFDHVGLALRRPTDLWPMMADALGGRFQGRGDKAGYGWTQLRFANGFVLEGLHPEFHEGTDFLDRFLEQSGPGPHHLTFNVPDLDAAIRALVAHGIEPVAEDRSDPEWLEVVIRPGQAHGTVVQLVQLSRAVDPVDPPEGFPELPFDHPVASLGRVVHAVADLAGALGLFRDVLGGRVVSSGSAIDGNHWVELGWGGPGRLRLLEAVHSEIAAWVGTRPGRLRHLFFSFDEPSHVPGAHQVASGRGRWVVDADDVLGTRLVIASSAR
jgi:catechol 2,3-dioxygenase-like lactoylglutathione lyase family enzyme